MSIRALIVDDEPMARGSIRRFLRSHTDIEVIGECGDGQSAVAAILSEKPDLVFLDVEMPEIDQRPRQALAHGAFVVRPQTRLRESPEGHRPGDAWPSIIAWNGIAARGVGGTLEQKLLAILAERTIR